MCTEDEVDGGRRLRDLAGGAVATVVDVLDGLRRLPLRAHVEQVHEEVVRQRPGPVGEDAVRGLPDVGVERPQAADQHRQLRRGEVQHERAVQQQGLRRQLLTGPEVVAEPVGLRFEHGERLDVRLLLRGVGASRFERDGDVLPGVLRRLLDGGAAAQDDEVGEGDRRVVGLRAVEVLPDLLEGRQHVGEPVVDLPVALRREADPRPVGPAALVGAAEARRGRPGQGDQLGDRQARAEDALLERGDVLRR